MDQKLPAKNHKGVFFCQSSMFMKGNHCKERNKRILEWKLTQHSLLTWIVAILSMLTKKLTLVY